MKLKKKDIEALHPETARYYRWDDLSGFGIAVHPSGHKAFVLKYRSTSGRQCMVSLGAYGALTVEQGRKLAQDMLHEVRGGGDPAAERQESRKGITVAEVCQRFLDEHAALKKPSTTAMYEWIIRAEILPALGKKRVDAVTESDVSKLIHHIGKEHPPKANRVRAALSKLFSLSERWGLRPRGTNPVTFLDRYKETPRHRDLNAGELKALADALASMQDDTSKALAVTAVRLLLFTGCRRGEVLNLRWSEVDLERSMLHLGDSKTGAKTVYLNSAACEILEGIERIVGSPYVFPSYHRPEGRPVVPMPEWELREIWERVREKAGLGADGDVKSFRIHDLRHSFAALGAGAGLSLPQIGELLGHSQARTTERYADLVNGPNVQAAELIGQRITEAMNAPNKKSGEVVALPARDGL